MSFEQRSYLVQNERTLQAALAGTIGQQVGLDLLKAGQQRAAGAATDRQTAAGSAGGQTDVQVER